MAYRGKSHKLDSGDDPFFTVERTYTQRDLDLAVLEARISVVDDIEGMLDSGGWEFVNRQDFEDYKADLQKRKAEAHNTMEVYMRPSTVPMCPWCGKLFALWSTAKRHIKHCGSSRERS